MLIASILAEASSDYLDEMTEIRVLQMLLTFLDPHTIQLSKEFVHLVIQCCFQIFDTKSLAVKSTIQATLKQMFTIVLDRFVDECRKALPVDKHRNIFSEVKHGGLMEQEDVNETMEILRVHFQDGDNIYLVVLDIIQTLAFTVLLFDSKPSKKHSRESSQSFSAASISNPSQQVAFNFKSSPFSKCVVLDLINLCLSMTNEIFRFMPDIASIFEL